MKKSLFLISSLLIVVFCSGCMSATPYKYTPSEKINTGTAPILLTVSVMILEDLRDHDNADYMLVGWIPFVPYGWARFSRPEDSFKFSFKGFKPREDFAKALYEEIKQNNLFKTVVLAGQKNDEKADLVITGKIRIARVDSTVTFYGLSFLGEVPWLIGLPIGKVYNELDVQFEMRRFSDGSIVWQQDVTGEWSKIIGAYYNSFEDEPYTGINKILQHGLHKGIAKLVEDIRSKPLHYWK